MKLLNSLENIKDTSLHHPVAVYVGAPWCQSCKTLSPGIDTLAKMYTDIEFVKIGADTHENLACELQVNSLPYVVIFHHGEIYAKFSAGVTVRDIAAVIANLD